MGIYINNIDIYPLIEATPDPDIFLRGAIGTKFRAEITFYIEAITISDSSTDSQLIFVPSAADSGLSNNTDWVFARDGVGFAEFNVGDQIRSGGGANVGTTFTVI